MIRRLKSTKLVAPASAPEPKSSRKEKISILSQEFSALFPQLMESITAEKQIEENVEKLQKELDASVSELRGIQAKLKDDANISISEIQTSLKAIKSNIPEIAKQIAKEVYEAQPKIPPQEIHHKPVIQTIENTLPIHTERIIERIIENKRTHESRSLTFHYDRERIVKAVGQDETYTVKYNQFGMPSEILVEPKE